MTRTAVFRPLLAVAVVPLVVIVGLHGAWAAYACRDGQVRDQCCCRSPADRDDRGPADGAPRIAAPGCCEVSVRDQPETQVARAADGAASTDVGLGAPIESIAIVDARVARTEPIRMVARPPPRVALYLDKQALLR